MIEGERNTYGLGLVEKPENKIQLRCDGVESLEGFSHHGSA